MACALRVVVARERSTTRYFRLNPRLNNLSESVMFWLFDKISDTLKYFSLYQFALRMGTDPVRKALEYIVF